MDEFCSNFSRSFTVINRHFPLQTKNSSSTCMLVLITHTVRQQFLYTAVLTVSVLCLSLFCYIYISLLLLCVDITIGTASLTCWIIRARLRTFSEKEKRKKERNERRINRIVSVAYSGTCQVQVSLEWWIHDHLLKRPEWAANSRKSNGRRNEKKGSHFSVVLSQVDWLFRIQMQLRSGRNIEMINMYTSALRIIHHDVNVRRGSWKRWTKRN